jgi:hypothetical protein
MACEHGDYLCLTSTLRSTLAEIIEIDAVEGLDEMEDRLTNRQEMLRGIKKHESGNGGLNWFLQMLGRM